MASLLPRRPPSALFFLDEYLLDKRICVFSLVLGTEEPGISYVLFGFFAHLPEEFSSLPLLTLVIVVDMPM